MNKQDNIITKSGSVIRKAARKVTRIVNRKEQRQIEQWERIERARRDAHIDLIEENW